MNCDRASMNEINIKYNHLNYAFNFIVYVTVLGMKTMSAFYIHTVFAWQATTPSCYKQKLKHLVKTILPNNMYINNKNVKTKLYKRSESSKLKSS